VLARPEAHREIAAALSAAGLARNANEWVMFRDSSAYAVELAAAESWGLPGDELARLYEEALPIEGMQSLVRPAPHHALLILARLGFSEKRRARIDAALAERADAWEAAVKLAPVWKVDLEALRRGRRRRSLRPVRGHVVSLSGLDGAGKSSQAAALRDALAQLGHEAVVLWTPLGANPFIQQISTAARAMLRLLAWIPPLGRLQRRLRAEGGSLVARPGTAARSRSNSVLAGAWASFVALVNAFEQRFGALRHTSRGRIVIFDRYTLDSVARLRYLHGGSRRFQAALIAAVSPTPLASFLLDVPAETARGRKQDEWDLEALRRQAELYREEVERLGVVRLDGERPPEELAAEIARTVWERLAC
jgi:thymidylate kinase